MDVRERGRRQRAQHIRVSSRLTPLTVSSIASCSLVDTHTVSLVSSVDRPVPFSHVRILC